MRRLCADAAAIDPRDAAAVTRLRRFAPPELVAAALDLAEAQRRAERKFPGRAATLAADPTGVEMASSLASARHKARRFAARLGPGARVLDLCCGIGGDAIALVDAGLRVLAVDLDPLRAWMAGHNAGCESVVADATRLSPADHSSDGYVLDPARRAGGRDGARSWRLDFYQPGPDEIAEMIARWRDGAVKLGPGVEYADAAALARKGIDAEVEYLSENGTATQCVLWTGRLAGEEGRASARTCATALRACETAALFTMAGDPAVEQPCVEDPVGEGVRWLAECDVSIERARLLGEVCRRAGLSELFPGLGLLCAAGVDELEPSPWCTRFRVLHAGAWNPRRAPAVLAGLNAGVIEVKTRGGAVNPDEAQRALRGSGSRVLTVFVLRLGRRLAWYVTERMESAMFVRDC